MTSIGLGSIFTSKHWTFVMLRGSWNPTTFSSQTTLVIMILVKPMTFSEQSMFVMNVSGILTGTLLDVITGMVTKFVKQIVSTLGGRIFAENFVDCRGNCAPSGTTPRPSNGEGWT